MAEEWLKQNGVWARLSATLQPVLLQLWVDGYTAGLDRAKANVLRTTVRAAVAHLSAAWLYQIVKTTIALLAAALVAGAALASFLMSDKRAEMIAETEVQRAMNQAAMDAYVEENVTHVRWIAGGPDPCVHCLDNQAQGAWPLGVPFPSGALAPPQHPHCHCWIERA